MTLRKPPPAHSLHSSLVGDISPESEWDILIRARLLLLMGYATFIVEIETGLAPKRIRKIRNDLIAEGVSCPSPRSLKRASSRSLIRSRTQQQHASILMSLYTSLHRGYAQDTDPLLLGNAYGLFLGAMQSVGVGEYASETTADADEDVEALGASQELLSITDAWTLAAELRAHEGAMIECVQCGTWFFEAIHQHYLGDHPCPWCG